MVPGVLAVMPSVKAGTERPGKKTVIINQLPMKESPCLQPNHSVVVREYGGRLLFLTDLTHSGAGKLGDFDVR